MTETVKQLLIINIIFYVGSNINGDFAYQLLSEYFPSNPNFRFWQPLTSMFMHAPVYKPNAGGIGIMHIAFNMFALVSFGSALEHFWGGKKFLFFYISCGLGAALLHTGVNYYEIHSLLSDVSILKLTSPPSAGRSQPITGFSFFIKTTVLRANVIVLMSLILSGSEAMSDNSIVNA